MRIKGPDPAGPTVATQVWRDSQSDEQVAAEKGGVVAPPRTFGFHTFRRTLGSILVGIKVYVKTVQEILRHQNLKTTLEIYAKAMSEDKLQAQGMLLEQLLQPGQEESAPRLRFRRWTLKTLSLRCVLCGDFGSSAGNCG